MRLVYIISILSLLSAVLISGCINQGKEVTTTTIQTTTTTTSTTTTIPCSGNCTGSAGLCKEYKCLEGTCAIITLSNCCGNEVCEGNETEVVFSNCTKDCGALLSERNHSSCKEEGKIKVLVMGLIGSKPPYTDDLVSVLNEAIVGYPVELTVHRIDMSEAGNDSLSKEYSISGYPTTIIDCHYFFTGGRNVENCRIVFDYLLNK